MSEKIPPGKAKLPAAVGADPPPSPTEPPHARTRLTADPHLATQPAASVSTTDLPPVFGRYRVQKKIGEGGMGAVYLAEDSVLKRLVALKVPQFDPRHAEQMQARFLREAQVAAQLSQHTNICQVYDVGEIDGRLCMAMEFIDGRTLSTLIKSGKPLPDRQTALLVRKVALAVDAAHQKGLIHRDLKPANIMLAKADGKKTVEPKVMDFGLAKSLDASAAQLTQTGMILGTPCYMSKEQWSAKDGNVGPASDVYSLGVIFYELLTGQLPYDGDDGEPPTAWLARLLTLPQIPPRERRPNIPPELEKICLKAIAKEPSDRYATMADLAAALQEWLNAAAQSSDSNESSRLGSHGFPIIVTDAAATPTLGLQLPRAPISRKKLIAVSAAGMALAAMLAVIIIIEYPDGTKTRIETDAKNAVATVDQGRVTIQVDPSDESSDGKAASPNTHQALGVLPDLSDSFVFFQLSGAVPQLGVATDHGDLIVTLSLNGKQVSNVKDSQGNPIEVELVGNMRACTWFKLKGKPLKPVQLADSSDALREQAAWLVGVDQKDANRTTTEEIRILGKKHLQGILAEFENSWLGAAVFNANGHLLGFSTKLGNTAKNVEARKAIWLIEVRPKLGTSLESESTSVGSDLSSEKITDKERTALEWILANNGNIQVRITGESGTTTIRNLPTQPVRSLEALSEKSWRLSGVGYDRSLSTLRVEHIRKLRDLPRLPLLNLASAKADDVALNEVGRIDSLTSLFCHIDITGEELASLSALPNLTYLSLFSSRLTDAGLACVAQIKSLRRVSLGTSVADSGVTDSGIEHLSSHRALTELIVTNSKITDAGLPHLAGLPLLQTLYLTQSLVSDSGIAHITSLPGLSTLGLSATNITDSGLQQLHAAKSLTKLYIRKTRVTATGVSAFQAAKPNCKVDWDGSAVQAADTEPPVTAVTAPNSADDATNALDRELAELVISKRGMVRIQGSDAGYLKQVSGLPNQPFDLNGVFSFEAPGLTDEDLQRLAPIAGKITQLRLDKQNLLTPAGIKVVSQMQNLTQLMLGGISVTREMLDAVGPLLQLEVLELQGSPMTDDWLGLLQRFPKLKTLYVSDTMLSARGVEQLCRQHPALNTLALQRVPLTGPAVAAICSLPNLRTLMLEGRGSNDEALARISQIRTLTHLVVHGSEVSDTGAAHLSQCKTLERLSLSETRITDATLALLAELPALQTLWIAKTAVTPDGVAAFRKAKPNCRLSDSLVADSAATSTEDRVSTAKLSVSLRNILDSDALVKRLVGHTEYVSDVAFSPDSSLAASASGDNTVRLWDTATGNEVNRFSQVSPKTWPARVAFSSDGKRLIATGHGTVVWDVNTGAELSRYPWGGEALAAIPDTASIIVGDNGRNRVLDLATSAIRAWPDKTNLQRVIVLPNSQTAVSCGRNPQDPSVIPFDDAIAIWKIADGARERSLAGNGYTVAAVACSSDGKLVAACGGKKGKQPTDRKTFVRLWDLPSGKEVSSVERLNEWDATSLAFLPDGQRLLVGLSNGSLVVWDPMAAQGQGFVELPQSLGYIYCLAISSDHKHVLTGYGSGGLRLLDLQELLKRLGPAVQQSSLPDPTRDVAERLLRKGIFIKLAPDGPEIKEPSRLPRGEFDITNIGLLSNTFGGNLTDEDLTAISRLHAVAKVREISMTTLSDVSNESLHLASQFTGLTTLHLKSKRIDDTGVAHLRGNTRLTSLGLGEASLTDESIAIFLSMPQLEHLSLPNTDLSDTDAQKLAGLTNLKELDLSQTNLSEDTFAALTQLERLESLTLSQVRLPKGAARSLASMTTLTTIKLDSAKLTAADVSELVSLPKLQSINLSNTNVGDEIGEILARCVRLSMVPLDGTAITDHCLKDLQQIKTLTFLHVRRTNVTAEGVAAFKKARPKCTVYGP